VNPALPHRYDCDRARLPASLADAFVALAPDDATKAFLARPPHRRIATVARRALGSVLSDYDANALLNVLDRAPRPLTLLERARALVAPGGRLVVAVPLPLSPHVHVAGGTVDPEELLPTDDATEWEPAVASLVARVFAPLALHVERLARAVSEPRGCGLFGGVDDDENGRQTEGRHGFRLLARAARTLPRGPRRRGA